MISDRKTQTEAYLRGGGKVLNLVQMKKLFEFHLEGWVDYNGDFFCPESWKKYLSILTVEVEDYAITGVCPVNADKCEKEQIYKITCLHCWKFISVDNAGYLSGISPMEVVKAETEVAVQTG